MKITTEIVVDDGKTSRHGGELIFDTEKHNFPKNLVVIGPTFSVGALGTRQVIINHVLEQVRINLNELLNHEDHGG